MGLYDREYYREEHSGLGLRGPSTIVGALILVNVAVYLVDQVLDQRLTGLLALHADTLTRPWLWWQFLTYGFLHAPEPSHIIFNMLGLFIFGRDIEATYGRKEFLRLYLVLLVVASIVWASIALLQGAGNARLVGASGAVAGVIILYALHFPHRTLLLFFIIPVPAWLLGVLLVVLDAMGAMGHTEPGGMQIAYTAHLAGAGFAFLYYRSGWNLGRFSLGGLSLDRLRSRPRLRVHDPDREDQQREAREEREAEEDRALGEEVDRILEKIHLHGEASLTRQERRTLESASRRFQRRRRSGGSD